MIAPRTKSARFASPLPVDLAASADAFLLRHGRALFGREPTLDRASVLEWRRTHRTRSRTGVHLWSQQYVHGVAIEGAWMRIQLTDAGEFLALESRYRPGLEDLDPTPRVTATSAQQTARAALGREGPARAPESAELVHDPERGLLIWKLTEALWSPFGDWRVEVDAKTGELLEIHNLMSHGKPLIEALRLEPPAPPAPGSSEAGAKVDSPSSSFARVSGSGWVLPANPLNGQPGRYDLRDGDPVDGFRENQTLARLDGSGYLRGDYVDAWLDSSTQVFEPSLVFEFSADQLGSAFHAVNAYWHIDVFQDYLRHTLGIIGANERRTRIVAHAFSADNSVYSPVTDEIQYGDGGVDDAEDGEVVLHEYGHAIHENIVPDYINQGESGAISEGFGDYVAASFGGNALVAEWDATAYQPGPPPYLRRVDTDKHFPEDRENQVHADGEIISGVWWRLWNELGKATADQLVVESFFLLGPNSGFSDFADAMLQVDEALFGGAHLAAIHTAYRERGIPISYPLVISTTPLADTSDLDGPYSVLAQVAHAEELAQSDPVQLHWRHAGNTTWTVLTMAEVASNEWSAEIPGDGQVGEIEYAITALDAQGVRVWAPENGPQQFFSFRRVGDEEPPTLVHTPIADTPITLWSPVVHAQASDPSGIASVRVDWYHNGMSMSSFHLSALGAGDYEGIFPFPPPVIQVGDEIQYIVTASDSAATANTAQSGPHRFEVLESRGSVLVLIDEGDLPAPFLKYGWDKEPLPTGPMGKESSGETLVVDLMSAGFEVRASTLGQSDPLDWPNYDALVLAAGGSTTPVSNADFRDDLLAWISGGGKLLVEGGEIGFDASSNPGYPSFASTILHVDRWDADDSGALSAAAGSEFHPLRTTPHPLPASLALGEGLLFGEQDSMVPSTDAQLIYGSEEFPGDAGVLVFDDNAHPSSAQIVYWAFSYAALSNSALAAKLADNTLSFLLAEEPPASSRLAGMVSLKDGSSAEGLTVRIKPSGLSTLTDASGFFEFIPLYAGVYSLEVEGPAGYETTTLGVSLMEGEDRNDLEIELRSTITQSVCDATAEPIPDNDADGVVRLLDPLAEGEVVGVRVELEITHSWRGDLFVELSSPSGTTVVLHNRSGSDLDDLHLVYPDSVSADGPGHLVDFRGEDAAGAWILRVKDLGAGDTGEFVRACLELVTATPRDVPILASGLRGSVEGRELRLSWSASEAAGEGAFSVLRSIDGERWDRRNPLPIEIVAGPMEYLDDLAGIHAGASLRYRLEWNSDDGQRSEVLSEFALELDSPAPRRFVLEQNHPNPFNPRTTIVFSLSRGARASLRIYDLQGRQVITLRDETMDAGEHRVIWNGLDSAGNSVAAGTYFYELRSGGHRRARPMVLVK